MFPASPAVVAWIGNNMAGQWKRAVGMALSFSIANLAGGCIPRAGTTGVSHSISCRGVDICARGGGEYYSVLEVLAGESKEDKGPRRTT